MAAALRALKLPGKKGSELGEYDPLTQADSDDESEEDDLVLNYPRNGLGRGSCLEAADSRGGRTRLVEEELEEEEEDRSEGLGAGLRQDGTGLSQVGDPEVKKAKFRNAVRTAAFLLPLTLATLTILLCAFLLPCKEGALQHPQWETQLGDVEGVTSPPMALWDVDGDGMEDLLISVTTVSNSSLVANGKEYSVVAVSGAGGAVMWIRSVVDLNLKGPVSSLQCGLQTATPEQSSPSWVIQSATCLLITRSSLTAINASSGKKLWSVGAGEVESRAVLVPDVDGDTVPDLLIAALPADKESDLALVLHSGVNGSLIGRSVSFNLTTEGKLIGPLLHETTAGAFYILFGLGTVEAVSLQDIYKKATGRRAPPFNISLKDPTWEKQRRTNRSTLIHIYSDDYAEYLLPLVAGVSSNCDNLDARSRQNSSRSDLVLLSSSNRTSLIRERDTHTTWTLNTTNTHGSRPAVGYFNDDAVPDLLIQQSSNGVRKVQVIDGVRGVCLWEAEFVCPLLVLDGSSIMTEGGPSVFLFWGGDPLPPSRNTSKVNVPKPVQRRLFLLYPAYPTILQQLISTTDTALTATVSYQEVQKDASYVVVLSRPMSGLGPGSQVVKSISVRAALTKAVTVHLEQESKPSTSDFHINKIYRQLTFRKQ